MKNLLLFIGFTTFLFCTTSCNPKFYTPNTHNVPLLTEKGETNLSLSGNANQVEFLGAYGIGKNFAVVADGGLFIPKDLDNGDGGSGKFLEIGGGYFKPLDNHLVFEAYGLVGFGSVENHFPSTINSNPQTLGKISANILRIGIQPNFGYKTKYFSAAISARICNLSYNKIDGSLYYENEFQTDYLSKNSSNFLVEPALTIRGGLKKIKLQLQYGLSFNVSNADFRQDKNQLTVGLNFNFN
jgi:hypothetical protein